MIAHPYVETAVSKELAALRSAAEGGRANATFKASAAIGSLLGAGAILEEEAEHLLLEAAIATGLPHGEALSNIRHGLKKGTANPRQLPDSVLRSPVPEWKPPPGSVAPTDTPEVKRPPIEEVQAVWEAAEPVTAHLDAVSWFQRLRLDPARAEDWDLCRVLPEGIKVSRWAWTSAGGPWTSDDHRLVFLLFDAAGVPVSMKARCLLEDAPPPKSLAPAGFTTCGLVLADPLGVQLLQGRVPGWWSPQEVVIAEGETDWLTWALKQPDSLEQGPAVFGIHSGAWTAEVAARVPDGAQVAIRTDRDDAGDDYAARIHKTLEGRCQVWRAVRRTAQ